MTLRQWLPTLGLTASILLAGCGGGGSATPAAPATPSGDGASAAASAPGGIYVGFYAEDSTSNPEDPTVGAVAINLPAANEPFAGAMYFTYYGCQSENVGHISGNKTAATISGDWSGTLDGYSKNGQFTGTYLDSAHQFKGTYTVTGPKQHVIIPDCDGEPFDYYIGPNGTFELFPEGAQQPSTFTVNFNDGQIQWTAVSDAVDGLVYVTDPDKVTAGQNPVLWQAPVSAAMGSYALPEAPLLTAGKSYIAVVALRKSSGERAAFASKRFTP